MAGSDLVADASAIAKWYLRDEDLLTPADQLLADWTQEGLLLSGPGHLPYEVVHSIRRARLRGRLDDDAAERAIANFARLSGDIILVSPELILREGELLSRTLGVSFFDACYLQVARLEGVRLLTADAAFYRQTRSQADVLWLGDYSQIR
ncbi:MAG: type II toxin-antitoxin system VapC family toxin [Dehalococcoidia bacterium]